MLTGWESFFVALAGVGAALAGLIIVAITVTIKEILASKALPSRAAATIASLVLVVVASGLMLVPRQSATALGVELVIAGVFVVLIQAVSLMRIFDERPLRPAAENAVKIVLGVAQILPFMIGAVLVLLALPAGVYWIALGMLVTIACATMNAWVLLVEVQR